MASNKDDRSSQVLATLVSLLILTTLVYTLRVIARKVSDASFWVDDLFIGIAQLGFLAAVTNRIIELNMGLGKHIETIKFDASGFQKESWASQFIYQVVICAYKLSLAFMYYRIFALRKFRIAIHIVTSTICVYSIWSVLQTLFQCVPIAAKWRTPQPGDHCIPAQAYLPSLNIPNVILDWVLLFLPMPVIWKLQTSVIHKVELSAVLLMGCSVCIISIIRLVKVLSVKETDTTWSRTTVFIWTHVEMGTGIICPCLITLRPLLRRIRWYPIRLSSNGKTGDLAGTDRPHESGHKPPGGSQRMRPSVENDDVDGSALAYHTVITSELHRSDSDVMPLAGIKVMKDVDLEVRQDGQPTSEMGA